MPNPDLNITALVETFGRNLTAAMEASAAQRIHAALADEFGPPKRGPGRPPRPAVTPAAPVAARTAGKKRLRQRSQMPWFENPASPSFEMACTDLGDTAESKTKKHRQGKVATPKGARSRKLQGQYLGALKSLKGANRAKVKRTAKEKGVAEAVKLALSLKKS